MRPGKFLGVTLVSMSLIAVAASAQEPQESAIPWGWLSDLVGAWAGEETGRAGTGRGERRYEMILGERYVFADNVSRFDPQEQNPRGETHGDWAIFSYDQAREKLILREFHSEGYVIEYVAEGESGHGAPLIFVSERVENAPAGTRARYSLTPQSDGSFVEKFEVAFPGQELQTFLENRWRRVKTREGRGG